MLLRQLPGSALSSADALRLLEPLDPALRLLLKCQHLRLLRRLRLLLLRLLLLLLPMRQEQVQVM
jgi:hypothetical protein